jgi:outer membrane receptor for ferrienterochelin and colicins
MNIRLQTNFLIAFFILFLIPPAIAQHTMGKAFGLNDKGLKETLPGANVYWQGTTIGTAANIDGEFQIPNPDTLPAKLVISMVGFNSDTIVIKQKDKMDIEVVLKNTITLNVVKVEARQSSTLYSTFNPINTEIIGKKELLKAACCNLSESFSTNASVDVAFTDAVSGAKKIQMLGLDGAYTQILSENMPMLRGLSSAYGLNYIPGTWIDNIRVTKGTGSVVNGYESISGQINLEFLKPKDQKDRLFFNVYGNQKGRAEANVHYVPKINEKWGTLLFLHASELGLKNDMNKDSFLDMPLARQYNVFNRWNYHNQKNFEAQFGVKGLIEKRQGGQTNFDYAKDRGTKNAYGIGVNTNVLEYFSKTGWMFPSTPYKSIGLQTSGKWQQQDMFFGLRNYAGEQKNFYANLIFANIINNSNHKYKIGASYLLDDYNEKFNSSSFARTESVPGIFAEYTYAYAEKFSAVAGVREDFHNMFGNHFTPRLHLRYNVTKSTTLRLSGGEGFRTPNIFVENQSVFASSRQVIVMGKLQPEIAWNYGLSANQKFNLFGKEASFNVDFFRTDFQNQMVMDLDQNVNKVLFYNLDGKSFSNSLQTDFDYTPFKMFDIKLAYKWYDVKTTYHHQLLDKPYVPKHRIMLNLAYSTYMEIWKFNFTANWFGQSRLPNTTMSPVMYQLPSHSKSYFLMNAQITKKFRKFEMYLGCENIFNYTQKNAIVSANNPFGNNFDASMIYAPMDGRIVYVGMRMAIR